jgi:formate dehydrogenase subunit beta
MADHWVLETHADPLAAVRTFLSGLFQAAGLGVMLAPLRVGNTVEVHPVSEVDRLALIDPIAPVMKINAAPLVADRLREQPEERLGAVLRPCEIRALAELVSRYTLDTTHLLLIGVDCMGAFDAVDYARRGDVDALSRAALRFARQGGIAGFRNRLACQMCLDPMPGSADVVINLLGMPARTRIMVTAGLHPLLNGVDWAALTQGPARPDLVEQHERMKALQQERRGRARERILGALSTDLAPTVDKLIEHLQGCASCEACLQVCPVYTGEPVHLLTRDVVSGWLMSCAGCGMCEQACPDHLPLVAVFRRIRQELEAALAETP